MIKNEFEHLEGAMAKATRKRDARLVVHSFDHGVGVLAFRTEVVEEKVLVLAQHAGDLLHRLDLQPDERQVRVKLTKGFWLAKTEVTQAQWQVVMGDNPSSFNGDNLPVERVGWNDAQEFTEKVSASGFMPGGWKMVLPTEAQWEYACRAGKAGSYSGGSSDQVAWCKDNSGDKTHSVGTKEANSWGLHDMHGNVWEWCADWYVDELPGGTDPVSASSGVLRVGRGGSWDFGATHCRAAHRGRDDPAARRDRLGLRPALVPSE